MHWNEFKRQAPELAEAGETLFEKSGVVLLGTIRKDGSPRISPVEFILAHGKLYVGMMWQSLKARDLLRDPRCTFHNTIADRLAADGEFKLQCRAIEILDAAEREQYAQALFKKIGMQLGGLPYHLFAFEIHNAAFWTMADNTARQLKHWRAGEAVQVFRQGMDGKLVPVAAESAR